jgi:hypothetical protein
MEHDECLDTDFSIAEDSPVVTDCCCRLASPADTTNCKCGTGGLECDAVVCIAACKHTVSCETQGHNQDPILRDHAYRHVCGVSDTLYLCQHCQTQWEAQ